ncbi:transmembrane protein [Arabidopsis thaliana]|uniref:Transmembrane protein n=2 Tax=Arabidopsis thaliana TaxID=3702 RepID=A0A1P8B6X2_ARATH|nr:uncharacterized protein AT4G16040 [Arabidopsis thaliana]ANM67337.1 transmembrane protein [Arabidopsis thaliana]|eukprot:NP_001329171.1 transmembrane protein [Arabidopsis thaliana]
MLIAKMSVTPGGPIMIDDKAVTGKPVSQDPIVKKKDPVKTGKPVSQIYVDMMDLVDYDQILYYLFVTPLMLLINPSIYILLISKDTTYISSSIEA